MKNSLFKKIFLGLFLTSLLSSSIVASDDLTKTKLVLAEKKHLSKSTDNSLIDKYLSGFTKEKIFSEEILVRAMLVVSPLSYISYQAYTYCMNNNAEWTAAEIKKILS